MNSIIESELADFAKNKAIKSFNIVQSKIDSYFVVVTLTWKEGDWELTTARGIPREWASLDRLVRHIQRKYNGTLPPLILTLFKKD